MYTERSDIFIILLKLKSYLVSMIDIPENSSAGFYFTEEFLTSRFPEWKTEVMNLLRKNKIDNDSEIAFDHHIHHKFKDIVDKAYPGMDLGTILKKYEIEKTSIDKIDNYLISYRSRREKKLHSIVAALIELTKLWSEHFELQRSVDDYSTLNEEEVLRPAEEYQFSKLDEKILQSFNSINLKLDEFMKLFTGYLFSYGGDFELKNLMENLDNIKSSVNESYNSLFQRHGLNDKTGVQEDQ